MRIAVVATALVALHPSVAGALSEMECAELFR